MDKTPTVTPPDRRPRPLNVVGTGVTILAASAATGCHGITFQQGAEGTGPPPHSHDWDESFYVLSGEVNFRCGDEHHVCAAGTLVHVPRNTVHAFSYGKSGGSMLEITSPDGTAAEMFTEVDAEIDPAAPDIAKMLAVLRKNGVRVAE